MKVGLEVHQQLSTGKLFCACASELSENPRTRFRRRLQAAGGETQAVDAAVAFQAARHQRFTYETTGSDCLVEADEEPPHALNPEALRTALMVADLFRARPVDEIVVMRKLVVDGSNTSGFQRTALVAMDGTLSVGERQYSIPTICLEEDAARKISESEGEPVYRLDRLGIPLIEVATGPEITSGAEAREVAGEIGALLRATRRVRRGIGTIREDLNVSTTGGRRIEIKGVQELRLIERYAQSEEARQIHLLKIRDRLQARDPPPIPSEGVDLSALLGSVRTGPFRDLARRPALAWALLLPGYGGLLGSETADGERLGRELADYARSQGVRGLLHADELPGYGIEADLLARIRTALGAGDQDGFVLLAVPTRDIAERAMDRVRARAREAREGIPSETRDPLPDGRTRYSRPLPGRDRMYPETDVPRRPITEKELAQARADRPELPVALRARLALKYGLNSEVLLQIEREDLLDQFERFCGLGHAPTLVARLLTQEIPTAESERADPKIGISDADLERILDLVRTGRIAKEGVGPLLRRLFREGGSVEGIIGTSGFDPMTREELEERARALVDQNLRMLDERGDRGVSALMGDLMQEVRGRRDGREVDEVLRSAVAARRTARRSPP
ncbi:MAG: Glu-tRNA(Gln) amidotransferase subunit GatE [Thermoplasmata archaeon]